jgi:hypothetical protein
MHAVNNAGAKHITHVFIPKSLLISFASAGQEGPIRTKFARFPVLNKV